MRTRLAILVFIVLTASAGVQAKPTDSIDKDTVRKAITIFQRTPSNQQGSMVRPIILRYAQESPDVDIIVSEKVLRCLENSKGHEETGSILLTAYVAGDVRAQLARKRPKEDSVAGTEQVIATYRQLQQSEPRLRIMEVEKLIAQQRQGKLAQHLGTAGR